MGSERTDLASVLREKIDPLPSNSRDLDLNPVFGDTRTRKYAVEALLEALRPLQPNLLIAFNYYPIAVALVSDALGINFDLVYKTYIYGQETRRLDGVFVNENRLRRVLSGIESPHRIVFMDNVLDTGRVAGYAIDGIRKVTGEDAMQHALFMSAIANGGGERMLGYKQVEACVLTEFSPASGFTMRNEIFEPSRREHPPVTAARSAPAP